MGSAGQEPGRRLGLFEPGLHTNVNLFHLKQNSTMACRKKFPPEPFQIEVQSPLENGRGSAVHDGKALQVHGALPGERVMAHYLFGRSIVGQAGQGLFCANFQMAGLPQ